MRNSLTICAGIFSAVACMTAGNALASEGLDECLQSFSEKHVPEGTRLLVTDDVMTAAEHLHARGELRLTADLVRTPGNHPFGSVTCVLNRRGKLLFMHADLPEPSARRRD
jgi:hypothetical protein